jgi:hypothetical protein
VAKKIKIDWTRFEVVPASPEKLKPHPMNHRVHNKRQDKVLRSLIAKVGWTVPILVSSATGYIVDGHERRELALKEGVAEVPVIYLELTPQQELEILAAHDRVGYLAEMDAEILAQTFRELGGDYDLSQLGFDPVEVEPLLLGGWTPKERPETAKASDPSSKGKAKREEIKEDALEVKITDPGVLTMVRSAFEKWSETSAEKPTLTRFILELSVGYLERGGA